MALVPWWASLWVNEAPTVFLGSSVIAFVIGLNLYAWDIGVVRSPILLIIVFVSRNG